MNFQNKLKTILENKSFDQLVEYTQPVSWKELSSDDRELLGLMFVKQGEHQLLNGEREAFHSFDLAAQVAHDSPSIHYLQGFTLVEYGIEFGVESLDKANEALKRSTELNPNFLLSWYTWGITLVFLGTESDDICYFQQADDNFRIAYSLAKAQNDVEHLGDIHWHWGQCWLRIAMHSEEACDYSKAVEKLRAAKEYGCREGYLYLSLGQALVELSNLVSKPDLLIEAAIQYKQYLSLYQYDVDQWFGLAQIYLQLYDLFENEEHFLEADECFERTVDLDPTNEMAWNGWGLLYSNSGKLTNDIEKVEKSLEKFLQAAALNENSHDNLLVWGEAEMLVASHHENLELLHASAEKIQNAVMASKHNPQAWYVLGTCHCEFGRYFSEERYFLEGIKKYEYGLSIEPTHRLLLYAVAIAYMEIGELTDNVLMFEQALSHYARIGELHAPSAQVLSEWGVAFMKLGELTDEKKYVEAAAEKFEQAIHCWNGMSGHNDDELEKIYNCTNLEWLYNYGCALDSLGEYYEDATYIEKAIQIFSHIVPHEPDQVDVHYHLALSLRHLGELTSDIEQLRKSIEIFQTLVDRDREDEVVWNDFGVALLNLADLLDEPIYGDESQHLFHQAENKFQQAAALGNIYSLYNLACLYAVTNNVSATVHYLERAERSDALPCVADVIDDEWFEDIQDNPIFRQFIARLVQKYKNDIQE